MKKSICIGGICLALLGAYCRKIELPNNAVMVEESKLHTSCKLENLVDCEVKERELSIGVYIDKKAEDYEKKYEIFENVRKFFSEHKIKIKVEYSKTKFTSFNRNDQFGVEIYSSREAMDSRFKEIEKQEIVNEDASGAAIVSRGISLVNLDELKSESEFCKLAAAVICHEQLHQLGLWHANEFRPEVREYQNEGRITNIMMGGKPDFEKSPVGYEISTMQEKLIHSYVGKGNAYRAFFIESCRDFVKYLDRIAKENNLGRSRLVNLDEL